MTSLLRDVIAFGTGTRALCARPPGPRRQDRHDQRERRRLVLRLQRRAGRRRVDRLRPAADAGRQRDRRRGGAADLDRLHAEGAEGHARTRRCRRPTASSPCAINPETGLRDDAGSCQRVLLRRVPAAQPRRRRSAPGCPGGTPARTSATSSSDAGARHRRQPMRNATAARGTPARAPRPLRASTRTTARGSRRPRRGSSPSTASPTGRWPSARPRASCCCPTAPHCRRTTRSRQRWSSTRRCSAATRTRTSLRAQRRGRAALDAAPRRVVAAARRRRRRRLGDRAQRHPPRARRRRRQGRRDPALPATRSPIAPDAADDRRGRATPSC